MQELFPKRKLFVWGRKYHEPNSEQPLISLTGAGGYSLQIIKAVGINLTIVQESVSHEFLVVRNCHHSMLIGNNYLFLSQAVIDFHEKKVFFKKFRATSRLSLRR
jgi:hypothetical protein